MAPPDFWGHDFMGRGAVFMLKVLVGAALGLLSGLGVGGGSLLLLWLTIVMGMEQNEARLINLMFFLPCALVATFFRRKQFRQHWKQTLPAIAAGVLGAFLGNRAAPLLDTGLLKKALGILFILCGLREIFYRPTR